MQAVNFDRLKLRLLEGGVAPKYARRTVQELGDHLEELVRQEMANGLAENEAKLAASMRLGDEDKLLAEALAKKEILSWSRRYTKSVYLILPVVSYFFLVAMLIYFGVGVTRSAFNIDIYNDWPAWHLQMSKGIMFVLEYIMTPVLAACVAMVAIKRNVAMLWPVVGISIVCFFGLGFETIVRIPDETGRGGVNMIWGWPFLPWEVVRPPWPQSLEQIARVVVTMGAVIALFRRYQPYKPIAK